MAFKRIATLQFKKIYASDDNKSYYWRDFVKEANQKLTTDANFVPKNFYEYDTKNFLYITARAISGMEKWGCNGNYDAFPWQELKKSYPTFCGKGFYIEHKEDNEKDAKGIILDAQPDDDNEFINCICAISKNEYPDICEQILSGHINQVSMSCLAGTCECGRCGNVARNEKQLCEHMNPGHPMFCKGQIDSNGQPIYEINRDIVFTGLSGVAIPADKDAYIFDVKASKKKITTIDKEYQKYCRAKKEYEYINNLLEDKDVRNYIKAQLDEDKDDNGNENTIYNNVQDENKPQLEDVNKNDDIKDIDAQTILNDENKVDNEDNDNNNTLQDDIDNNIKDEDENENEKVNIKTPLYANKKKKANKYLIKTIDGKYLKMPPITANNEEDAKIICSKMYTNTTPEQYIAELYTENDYNNIDIDFINDFMNAGKSKGSDESINKEQLEMGIKVEMEHTNNVTIAKKIACDHLKEIPNYYTLLADMEAMAKAETYQSKQIIDNNHKVDDAKNQVITANKKQTKKQFFKIKKSSSKWFKITKR